MEASGKPSVTDRLTRFFARAAVPGVQSAYLFGGHAAGAAHAESDIDVAVLVDRTQYDTRVKRDQLRVELGAELIQALQHNDVDLVSLHDVPPALGRRIITEGTRVHCADAEADHAFVRDVQLRAADLDPFLRKMRRITLEALRT